MGFGYGLSGDRTDWTILTIGRLTVNKHWGETERVREPFCTCTVIRTARGLILIDPSVPPTEMPGLLHSQVGLRTADIAYVFVTHCHVDHRAGLAAFPNARWLMSEREIDYWRERYPGRDEELIQRIEPVEKHSIPAVEVIPTPGHTPGHAAVIFPWRGRRVLVAGDAVMTEDHFVAREGHLNSTDSSQARTTIERLAGLADLVVPGHDKPFVAGWVETSASPLTDR